MKKERADGAPTDLPPPRWNRCLLSGRLKRENRGEPQLFRKRNRPLPTPLRRQILIALSCGLLLTIHLALSIVVISVLLIPPSILPRTTAIWAGYVSTGGIYTDVRGQWQVPVNEHCQPTEKGLAAYWVGLGSIEPDGKGVPVLEQIGTLSGCDPRLRGGIDHQAVYEMIPGDGPHFLTDPYLVDAGDTMRAAVQYDGKQFRLSLTNETHRWDFSITLRQSQIEGALSSAEWIVESPPTTSGPSTLLHFGTIRFEQCFANNKPIDGSPITYQVMMKASDGNDRARPSDIDTQHHSFAIQWLGSGP